ncbi:MAG: serine hydrolase [Thermostichales cyanobacterium GMQP_bins_62]
MPEQRPRRRPRRDPRRRGQLYRWQRLLTRLGVLTLGGSLVLGGLSSLWRGTEPTPAVTLGIPSPEPQPLLPPLDLRVEQTSLQQELAALNPSPRLTVSALFLDLDTGEYAQLDPEAVFPAASTIKLPILVALLEAVDQGQVTWTEPLTLTSALLAGEAGTLKNRPLGSRISVLEAGTLMSVISDNTGTNLIIDRLGGIEGVNERFRAWGLRHTQLNALLPDLPGTNTTSTYDMVQLLYAIEQGKLLSRRSRDHFWTILFRTRVQTLLTPGLGEGSRIYHKTGDIGGLVGDVGMIDMANGRRYLAAVLVKRDHNNRQANELIRQMSRLVYQYWDRPVTAPETSPDQLPVPEG